jgi:hypothetical protein
MKRSIYLFSALALFAGLTVFARGQWQMQPQMDPRVGPIYPVNPSFNFHSASNYDPYQFNWASGRWDYIPVSDQPSFHPPLEQPAPYRPYADQSGQWIYGAPPSVNPAPVNINPGGTIPQTAPPAPKPDDSELWTGPTTRPGPAVAPQIVKFEGRICAIKAVNLDGESTPHLLLRLRNDAGATGTIDAGQRLMFPDTAFDPGSKGEITVTGQLGILDGHLLLFADQIAFGSKTVTIERHGKETPK